MSRVFGCFQSLGRYGAFLPLVGLLVGCLLPPLSVVAREAVPGLTVILTFASVLTVTWRDLQTEATRASSWLGVVWLLAAPATLAFVLFQIVAPGLTSYALLCALSPPIGAVTGLARIMGLRPQLALFAFVVLTALAPLSYPAGVVLFGAASGGVPGMMMVRLLITVLAGGLLALACRRRLAPYMAAAPLAAPGLAMTCGAMLMLASASSMAAIVTDPGAVASIAGLAFGLNIALTATSAAVFSRLGWRTAVTIGLAAGNRSIGIAWTASGSSLSAGAEAFFALSLLATVVVPIAVQVAVRLTARLKAADGAARQGTLAVSPTLPVNRLQP